MSRCLPASGWFCLPGLSAAIGILVLVATGGCGGGKSERPLRLAVTDVEGVEQLQREFGRFRDELNTRTKLSIEFFPVSDRTASVLALENDQVDLVITGPAEYVIFRNRTNVRPLVGLYRKDYTAVFLVRRDSGIKSLSELRGTRVAMGAVGSTSKHLAPMHMLARAGVSSAEVEIFHTGIQAGWEALVHKDVKAFATTRDKYLLLEETDKDDEVILLAESDPLPMDVLLASDQLPKETGDKIIRAIDEARGVFVDAILTGNDNQKYRAMEFRTKVSDAEYDNVREMFRDAGIEQLARSTH